MYVACMEEKECYSTPYIHHLFLDVFKNVVIMVLKSFFIYFQLMYSKVNLLSSSTTIFGCRHSNSKKCCDYDS
jgi:hypothetical protein